MFCILKVNADFFECIIKRSTCVCFFVLVRIKNPELRSFGQYCLKVFT